MDFSGVWVELLANKRLKSNVYFHLKAIIWHHAGGIQGFSGLCSALIAHLLWQSCWLCNLLQSNYFALKCCILPWCFTNFAEFGMKI